ncbi:MAG: competence/damage-inducible protein A [Culicoidibacterales bacterium]
MVVEILCVGTELLLGEIVNTNAQFMAKRLTAIGVSCHFQTVVGDDFEQLLLALNVAYQRSDVVITCGGLGPTYDDITKEAMAAYFAVDLVCDDKSLAKMTAWFAQNSREMTPNNLRQVAVLEGAIVLENKWGIAPGILFEKAGKRAFMLPGPPHELEPMFEAYVVAFLGPQQEQIEHVVNVHLFGVGESKVESVLKDLMVTSRNPIIAPYAKQGEVLLQLRARASDVGAAMELIAPVLAVIYAALEPFIYGVDVGNLETALTNKLADLGLSVGVAESCTGGLLSARISSASSGAGVYEGGVCATSNDLKNKLLAVSQSDIASFGSDSREVAMAMANNIRMLTTSDVGIGMTGVLGIPGLAIEKSEAVVYIAVATCKDVICQKVELSRGVGDTWESLRHLATAHALKICLDVLKTRDYSRFNIRKTQASDVENVVLLLEEAKLFLASQGVDQWQDGYPNAETIKADIVGKRAYVYEQGGVVLGTVMLCFETDPTYDKIYEGAWQTNDRYGVIHRLAVDKRERGGGVAREILAFCEARCWENGVQSIKIDTHEDNIVMQKFLLREGFKYCGVIYLLDGQKRLAYQKKIISLLVF